MNDWISYHFDSFYVSKILMNLLPVENNVSRGTLKIIFFICVYVSRETYNDNCNN